MGSSFCQSRAIQNSKDSRDCQQVNHIKHISWTRVREQYFSTSDSLTVSGPSINGSKFAVTWVGEKKFWSLLHIPCLSNGDVNFIQFPVIPLCQNWMSLIISSPTLPPHIWVSLILFLSCFHPTQGEYIFLNHQPSPTIILLHTFKPPTVTNHHRSRHTLKPMLFNADSVATGVNWRPVSVWMSRSAKICTMSWWLYRCWDVHRLCRKHSMSTKSTNTYSNISTILYIYIYMLYSWKATCI